LTADLPEWLAAQLAVDVQLLTDPHSDRGWHAKTCATLPDVLYPGREPGECDCGVPERLAREIEAKRQLLILHRPVTRADFLTDTGTPTVPLVVCHECDANTTDANWPDYPCWTLRFLALPYADRSGYNEEEWAP